MADGTARSSGGGNHEELLKYFGGVCFEMHRCQDAKRHGLLRFELFKKIDKFLSLNLRNILISPLEGEKKFLSELNELRNFKEGYNLKRSARNSNSDRLLYFLKNINYNSDMLHHDKNYKGRLGILVQPEAGFEPSPEFLSSPQLTKKFNPLTKREGCDSVITDNLINMNHSFFLDTVFSRFTSHFSLKRKAAFTLAEVLITLGIIGIVASMTLPSLIQSYKERVTVTKVQKAYSILNQAFKRISEEYGEPQDWPGVEKQIGSCGECSIAHLNLYSNFISGEKYIAPRVNQGKKVIGLNGGFFTFSDSRPSLITPDGTFYFSHLRQCGVYLLTTGNRSACTMGGDILYDIDGEQKGPNQLGKDVFSFVTAQTGVYPTGMAGSYTVGDCMLNGGGHSCAEYILREKNMKYLKK